MNSLIRGKVLSIAALAVVLVSTWSSPCRAEVRVKDITMIEGARSNPLYGLGLVIGLNGTGASSLATQQLAIDLLRKLETTTKLQRQTQLDNVYKATTISMVMVTTEIPPFSRRGSRLDVVVSMFDDGTSLEGGTLLMTPLRGADGEVYAVAQGNVSIGGFRVRSSAGGQVNHPTNARIPQGAIVEKEALGEIDQGGVMRLLLRDADPSTATQIVQGINTQFSACAHAIDPGTIEVRIPPRYLKASSEFASVIGQIKVLPDTSARVIINERTGTVIVGHNVRISSVAIAHGSLVIKPNLAPAPGAGVAALPGAPPPLPRKPGSTADERIDELLEALKPSAKPPAAGPATLMEVEQTFTVAELARVLNALGVSPRDLIAIFQALERSGAMHASLEAI